MITCHKKFLLFRTLTRGYTLNEVKPCIVSEDGDMVTVDETHEAFPRTARPQSVAATTLASPPPASGKPGPSHGPGTQLKKLLSLVGITATPTCACNKRAKIMDANGCNWCEQNLDLIVGWLREEATKRKLPFIDAAGRLLVRKAIKNARRSQDREAPE